MKLFWFDKFSKKTSLKNKMHAIVDEIKRRTAVDCYKITVDKSRIPTLADSKLGGLPYWDNTKEYPTDEEGRGMFLLIQINFGQIPTRSILPEQGILQVFLSTSNKYYGADFDCPDVQKDFKVIYHEHVDNSITPDKVSALGFPVNTQADVVEYTPCDKEVALNIKPAHMSMTTDDKRFVTAFAQAVKDLYGEQIDTQDEDGISIISEYFGDDEKCTDYFFDAFYNESHLLLGYPSFTQYDPREDLEYYDTLLLQLVSDDAANMMWGDAGIGNFFINSEALRRKDFSKVLYTWDCG